MQATPITQVGASRSVWWVDYRDTLAPRQRMSREMILRNSLSAVFAEYMRNSSLCGMSKVVDTTKSKKERFFWLIVVLLAGACVLCTVMYSWKGFVEKPIIVTLESHNHPIHKIPFPGVSLCNVNRISKKAADEYANQLHPVPNQTLDHLKEQIYRMGRLLDFEIDGHSQLLPFIEYVDSIPDPDGLDYVRRMKKLSPKCEDMLHACSWRNEEYKCSELFNFKRTMNGYCCNFNYVRTHDDQGLPILSRGIKRQLVPGHMNGLTVVVNPQIDDYAYSLHNTLGFDILLYDGTTYPDRGSGRVIARILEPNQAVFLVLESITVEATNEVRKYSSQTRGCRFADELHSKYNGLYSYTSCIVECRMKAVQSLCKCVPFYLPHYSNEAPICTMFDLPCLDKFREKLLYIYPTDRQSDEGLELELEDSLDCPECLPDCIYTHHSTRTYHVDFVDTQNSFVYSKSLESKVNKSVLVVYHENRETTLYRMDVLYYWFELVSNLGGIAGVFVGYSIISFIELLYFFVFRFLFIVKENINKYL